MGKVKKKDKISKFEGKLLMESDNNSIWILQSNDKKFIEFKVPGEIRNKKYEPESIVKVDDCKVYVNGELQCSTFYPNECKVYDQLKIGKLTQSEFKNGQMYITMEDMLNNNKKTELVYPGELNHGEPYDEEKERYVKYYVQDEHHNMYITQDYAGGMFGHDYYSGSTEHLKEKLENTIKQRETPNREDTSEFALNRQIDYYEEIKKKLRNVRDKLAERKPDAFKKNKKGPDKQDMREEKKKRIKDLSKEHQDEIKLRKEARHAMQEEKKQRIKKLSPEHQEEIKKRKEARAAR